VSDRLQHRVKMRSLTSAEAVQSFAEVALGYSRDEAIAEARRAEGTDLAGATAACPFGVDVAGLVRHVAAGEFEAAHALVLEAHPWPGILGRYCHKGCEAHHSLGDGRETLFVSALERAASEHGAAGRAPFEAGPPTGKRVAIIGAGSAACAAAYRLRGIGHDVALFDQLPIGGGMTAIGYPDFRLPLSVVRRENALAEWGVAVNFEVTVDRPLLERLLGEYDAVIAGTGKFKTQPLDVPGEDLAGVWGALEFLTQVKLGRPVQLGRRIVVIGAGYSAQDSSRTALRLGSEVKIYYRRRAEDMPVRQTMLARYVSRQAEEGAPYVFQVAPVRLLGAGGKVASVEFVRTEPGKPDASGRPEGRPILGTEFTVECDGVIAAVGEVCDLSYLPASTRTTSSGHVAIDPATFATSVPRLFAAGEMSGTKGTENAFKSGLSCADAVDRVLRGGRVPC
jgi:NADPH-dependent glutamate synthase beta subunit-like oxidoreductase